MSLSKELEKLKFDKRLTNWYVSRGKFPKDELKKYLDALPDLAHNVDHFGLGSSKDDDNMPGIHSANQSGSGQY